MKSFREYLKESNLSYDQAIQVFGIARSYDTDSLKIRYRELATQNHPDRGGSVEKMKQINLAYDILKGAGGGGGKSSFSSMEAWKKRTEERRKISAMLAKKLRPQIEKSIDSRLYVEHFESIFNDRFQYSFKFYDGTENKQNFIRFFHIFSNNDNSIHLELQGYMFLEKFIDSNSLTSNENDIEVDIYTSIIYKGKKLKLVQSSYSVREALSQMKYPDKVFPKAKLEQRKKTSGDKKFTKKDALLYFQTSLGANVRYDPRDTYIWIPIGKFLLSITRDVMMSTALYNIREFGSIGRPRNNAEIVRFFPLFNASPMFKEDHQIFTNLVSQLRAIQSKHQNSDNFEEVSKDVIDFARQYANRR